MARLLGSAVSLLLLFLMSACSTSVAQPAGPDGAGRKLAQGPPPPAPVPPNASRVVAAVLDRSVWPPGSIQGPMPSGSSTQTLYSVKVQVQASQAEGAGLESLAVPGSIFAAFSLDVLSSELIGKRITATVRLIGDTRGVLWWISNVEVVP